MVTYPLRGIAGGWLLFTLWSAPGFAQADFGGNWAPIYHEDFPERIPGPELGDYMGIPINDAARLRGDSYDADRISVVPEYECRPHGGDYSMRGLANMRVDNILDPMTQQVVAIHTRMNFQEMERTIWLDGRPHPPELAAHTFQGFSTGSWDGNMLNAYTTHQKESYLRRNGLPRSDKATFREHWVRHGNYLTITTVITDPVLRSHWCAARPGYWIRGSNWAATYASTCRRFPSRRIASRITCRGLIRICMKWPIGTGCPTKRRGAGQRRCIRSTG
jgi:hypothetical protein